MSGSGTLLYDPSQRASEARNAALGAFSCAFSELGATGNVFIKQASEGEDALSNARPAANIGRYVVALHNLGEIDAFDTSSAYEPIEVESEDFTHHTYQACIPHVFCHGHHYFGAGYEPQGQVEIPWLAAIGRPRLEPGIITLSYALPDAYPDSSESAVEVGDGYGVTTAAETIVLKRRIPSTAAQQRERRETAALVTSIQSLLPGFSEEDLGGLVGVTRVAWRDWQKGRRAARSRKRRQLLKLRQILQLRQRTVPDTFLTHWLETPVGTELRTTPAELLAQGRDDVVAVLAARAPSPESDGVALSAPLDMGGLADAEQTAEALENARLYSQESESDDRTV